MIKAKMLIGLAVIVSAYAASMVPAMADFRSLNGTPKGQDKAVILTFKAGGAKFSCASAQTKWTIQKKLPSQEAVLKGGHLKVTFGEWQGCVAEEPIKEAVTVSECGGQLQQLEEKNTTPKGQPAKLSVECVIKSGLGCEVKVPGGSENENLTEWSAENSGKNVVGKGNFSGITDKVNATCEFAGIKSVKTGTWTFEDTAYEINLE